MIIKMNQTINNEVYQNKICKYCTNKENCNKDKIKTSKFENKVSIYCPDYVFENLQNI